MFYETPSLCLRCAYEIPSDRLEKGEVYCSNMCEKRDLSTVKDIEVRGLCVDSLSHIAQRYVTVDLLNEGFEVFCATSDKCRSQLVVFKGSKISLVEVVSGYVRNDNTISSYGLVSDDHVYDVLAIYSPSTQKIIYTPPFD